MVQAWPGYAQEAVFLTLDPPEGKPLSSGSEYYTGRRSISGSVSLPTATRSAIHDTFCYSGVLQMWCVPAVRTIDVILLHTMRFRSGTENHPVSACGMVISIGCNNNCNTVNRVCN